MRKIKLFLSLLMVMIVSVGNVWGAEELKATLDFTSNEAWQLPVGSGNGLQGPADYSDGTYTVNLSATTKYYFNSDGYLMIGKSGSKITLPAFSWKTTKIVVTGRTGASTGTKQNIYVGETAVSTETTGCTGANTYNIASANQAAGNVYVFQVTSNHNAQVTKIEIYGEAGGDDPTPVAVTGVTLDQSEAEVAVGKTITLTPTVAPSNATTKTVTWESDDEEVATVDGGVVTGVAEGTATITVKTTDGNKTATCEVTVTAAPAAVNYEKVTAEPADWSGEYLLVYEADATNARVWKGADQANYYAEAAISNGVIAAPDDAAVLTIAKVAESDPVVYTIQVGTKYIGQTSNSNGIKIQDAAINNSLSMESNGVGIVASEAHLRYNSASSSYFRYYKSSTYSSQNPIQLYKKADGKQNTGLAYDAADQKKLVKLGDAFTAPTLANPNNLTGITYASSDATVVEVNSSTGAIVEIKKAGVVVITASRAEDDTYKAGSASYTIGVTTHAGTEADPYVAADAKIAIDAVETIENAYATGIVCNVATSTLPAEGYISFYFSADGNTTGQQIEAYHCFGLNSAPFEAVTDVETGATVVVTGTLKKYQSTYEFDENCHLVSYTAPTAPKTPIISDIDNPITVASAITYIDAPATYDLSQDVWVRGVVTNIGQTSGDSPVPYIDVKDADVENSFRFFNYTINASITDEPQEGDILIATGLLDKYKSTYELNGCEVVSLVRPEVPVTSVELASAATVKVGNSINLSASVLPANATDKVIEWSIQSGNDNITLDNGAVTGVAEGTAVVRATSHANNTKYAECTITIEAADPTYAYYFYGKVTETAGIEDGQYLIVYEDESVAFNGGLETLDAAHNTIAVEIEDGLIVSNATTDAASFTIGVTAGTIQAAMGDYIGVTSYANGLKQNEDAATYPAHSFSIDEEENAIVSLNDGWSGTMILNYNTGASDKRFRYYKGGSQKKIQLYKRFGTDVAPKANPQLAWDPADDIEITVGDEFTSPALTYVEGFDGVAAVVIESDNTDLAIVTAGVVSLVADATGEANITATFAGNDNYKAATASYKITVNASVVPPTPLPTAEAKVIVVEYNSKFYAMSTTVKNSNGFEPIEVTKEDDKIIVKSDEEAAAIQWQIALGAEAATFQNGESKYLACSTESNTGLALLDDASEWAWDATASCYKQQGKDSKERTFYYNYNNGNPIFRAYTVSGLNGEGYSGAPEFIDADKIEVQVPTPKIDPELAFDPSEVELTLGEDFTAPTLNHVDGFNGTITYSSSKPAVATVDENTGVVTIVANGTTTITASFAGNDDYEEDEATYTITVNKPAPTPTSTIYRKVTATADITDGEYLIVYEGDNTHASVAFDGALATLDAASNNVAVTISEGVIAGNTEIDAAVFTINVTAQTLQSASGKFIGVTSNSNGLKQENESAQYFNTFAIDDNGNAVITPVFEGSTMALRYNYGSNDLRFRYYGVTSQKNIALYKKETAPEPAYTEVRDGLTEGWYYTMCLDKAVTAVKAGSIWRVLSKAANGTDVILEEVTGTLDAGRPYIFRAAAITLEVAYTGDAVGAPVNDDDNNGLIGSFVKEEITQSPNNYIIHENALYYVNSEKVYVGANRAYLDMTGVPAYSNEPQQGNNARRRVTMAVYGKDEAQGFDNLESGDAPKKVMIDGTLYILRGEKVYDATGRLVK